MPEQHDNLTRYALVLVVVGVLGRLLVMTLPLSPFSDIHPMSDSYVRATRDILQFNFHALGDRVPVYPLFIALFGLNPRVIWIAQSILGIAASLMIFDMAFRRTRHCLFSLFAGLTCSLIPEVLVSESWGETEALANFLLVTSLWLITRCDAERENNIRYPLTLGSIAALAGLTRPLMICLVPVYYLFLVPPWPPAKVFGRKARKRTLFFALPVVVLILGWCGFNYCNSGYFTPTTRSGQHLLNQVDPYVYLAPDRYAVLRDIWLQYRPQPLPFPNASAEDDYYEALPEMERRTGKTDIQISHELASMALYLEIHHPLFCLRRAEQGWMQFWGEPSLEEVEWPPGGKVGLLEFVTPTAKFLSREFKATFLVLALLSVPCALFRLKAFTRFEYLTFAIALGVSTIAAFAEFGEERRYCVPLYMLIFYTVLTRVWVWVAATSSRIHGAEPD